LTATVLSREKENIKKLQATINSFTDPFLEQGTDMFNLGTDQKGNVGKGQRRPV